MNAVRILGIFVLVALLCYCRAEGKLFTKKALLLEFKIIYKFVFSLTEIDWSQDPPLVVWNRVKDLLPIPPVMADGFTRFFEWCADRPRNPLCFSPLREIIKKINSYNNN